MSRRPATAESFWARVDRRGERECWPWTGYFDKDGYGQTSWAGKHLRAHRLAWQLANGAAPAGQVCHRCDNPPCCNPAHLWVGTPLDNALDKVAKGRWRGGNGKQTHCLRGHEYSPANTYTHDRHRNCRTCNRAAVAALKARRRAA